MRAHVAHQILGRDRFEHHQIADVQVRDLVVRASDRPAERAVRVTAAAVGRHHENQILRLLDHIRQELRGRSRLLELRTFGGDAGDKQRQDRDERHGRGEIPEARRRRVRHDPPQTIVEKRQQRDRREDHPRTRTHELFAIGFRRGRVFRFGRRAGRPGEKGEGKNPGKVVDETAAIQTLAAFHVAERQHHEADRRAERETAIRADPGRAPRRPHRADHARDDNRLLELRHELQRHRRVGGRRSESRRRHEERIEKAREDREAGDVDGRGCGDRLAGAAMRLREQREQRRDGAEEREHRRPRQPRVALKHQFVSGPSGQADGGHGEADGDRRPEQPLTAAPRLPAADDDVSARHWRHEQRGRAEPAQERGMAAQLPADENVGGGIEDSAKEPAHRVVCVHVSADGPAVRSAYLTESAPAFAACPSCSLVPPDAPMAPTILPSITIGKPPSTGTAP